MIFSALACTGARFSKNRGFDEYRNFDAKKARRIEKICSMLRQFWHKNRSPNNIKFLLGCLIRYLIDDGKHAESMMGVALSSLVEK